VEKICDRVGIIINGQMTVCENLQTLCGEKSLEDRFFEIYEAVSGEETDHDK
jgi:ABC-type multidrug transport system ATPase subunit